jgi:phosphoribosylanthranilate isomerase
MRIAVKICGLRTREDVLGALRAGADALGFVLAPSPRRVSLDEARRLVEAVPRTIARIAVCDRPSANEIHALAGLGFDALQADADWEGALDLPAGLALLPVLCDGADLTRRLTRLEERIAERAVRRLWQAVVLDGPDGGGRGVQADLERAAAAARSVALVLAGGLTPENVGERIARARPFGVDVSSGVERTLGEKDAARMQAFVWAARAAAEVLP